MSNPPLPDNQVARSPSNLRVQRMSMRGCHGDDAWLEIAEKWAKNADTRTRVFDDPLFVSRAIDTVKSNASPLVQGPTASASLSMTESHANAAASDASRQPPQSPPSESRRDGGDRPGLGQQHGQRQQHASRLHSRDEEDQDLHRDPAFHAPPPQVSTEAADTLRRLFTVLRNSCAGCPANNQALRHTGLAESALQFAVDQAPFACFGATASHAVVGDNISCRGGEINCVRGGGGGGGGSDATETTACNVTVPAAGLDAAGVRLAVRAGLQFACNYCVGSEENKTLLWSAWFPRGLMELVNGLKTDRGLLSLAVALIYNCCLPPPMRTPCEGEPYKATGRGSEGGCKGTAKVGKEAQAGGEEGGDEKGGGRAETGRDRLGRLVSDRAFCCLLMKVVVVHKPDTDGGDTAAAAAAASSRSADTDRGADPAAEWLYLLFCTFVQERLCCDVYTNVGIRAGGRPQRRQRALGRRRHPGVVTREPTVGEKADGGDRAGAKGATAVGSSAFVPSGAESEGPGGEGLPEGGGKVLEEEKGGEEDGEEEEDFFFPVTPEQLIVLNLAEMAAGDDTVTGGERPDSRQRQACGALVAWLAELLSAMPLSQTLLPLPQRSPPRASTTTATTTTMTGVAAAEAEEEGSDGEAVIDAETELVRRSMREEARSAALRALAAVLAGCCDETRRGAAAIAAAGKEPARAAAAAAAPAAEKEKEKSTKAPRDPGGDFTAGDAPTPPLPPLPVFEIQPERRPVPLCLRLLRGCGAAAGPTAEFVDGNGTSCSGESPAAAAAAAARVVARGVGASPHERGRMVSGGARVGTACLPGAAGGVPAGRKVELLKVIGNACFRCQSSQDLVREEGGLPLVLSHCGVDEANPLLREYALLAVRNLCEGNISNQESIAALQPQGYAPDAEEALADMGLKGKMDPRGKFSVGPSLA